MKTSLTRRSWPQTFHGNSNAFADFLIMTCTETCDRHPTVGKDNVPFKGNHLKPVEKQKLELILPFSIRARVLFGEASVGMCYNTAV